MCFWKKELCKVIILMYEIIRETIKVMEHIWDFYPEECDFKKIVQIIDESTNTVKKSNLKKVQKVPGSSKTKFNLFNGKRMSVKKVENVSLPKILINDVDASTLPSTNVKKTKFVLQKSPTTNTRENKKHELSKSDDVRFLKDTKIDPFDFLSVDSNRSILRSKIRNLNGISDKYASCQSSYRKITKSCNSSKGFRISNYKPDLRRSADVNVNRRDKSSTKKAPILNNKIN